MAPEKAAEVKDPQIAEQEEMDSIAEEAREELEGGENKKEKKEEKEEKKEEEKEEDVKENEEKEENEEEIKKKEEEEARQKEDERILASEDKDLKEEEKTRKAELVKAREEAEIKVEKEATEAYALKKKITFDIAKEERNHIKAIRKKYENPEDLADAFLHIQRTLTKTQEEAKSLREYVPVRTIENMTNDEVLSTYLDTGKVKVNGTVLTRDLAIEQFRGSKPDQTEGVTDKGVLAMIADNIRNHMALKAKETLANSKVQAKDKREKLVTSLPENDKKYSEEIREVLDNTSDAAVLQENYSLDDILYWVKGKHAGEIEASLESEKKKAYTEGYNKGKEEAKILGIKSDRKKSGGPSKKPATLTEAQKKEALDMFNIDTMSEEDKYEAYLDVMKKQEGEKET